MIFKRKVKCYICPQEIKLSVEREEETSNFWSFTSCFKVSNCWCDVIVDVKGELYTISVLKDTVSHDDDNDALEDEDDEDDVATCIGRYKVEDAEENCGTWIQFMKQIRSYSFLFKYVRLANYKISNYSLVYFILCMIFMKY